MVATALLTRRSSWDLDVDRAAPWTEYAACLGMEAEFTELMPGDSGPAAKSCHICRHHCPVFAQCEAETVRVRPVEVVQAGKHWPQYASGKPAEPEDPGCGPWCAELRGVRRVRPVRR